MSAGLRTLAIFAGFIAVALALHQIIDWRDQAVAAKACAAAVAPGARADADPAKACPPAIAADHAVAIRARACDAAFSARPENTYGVAATCSTPVKTVQADRDTARREAARLTADLHAQQLGQDAAVDRARADATTQAERKARAAAALKAAPRGDDGLVVCDAQCVRDRWADVATGRP